MKQPSLFRRIVEKYAQQLEALLDCDKTFKDKLQLNFFQEKYFDIATISPGCTYKNIEIANLNALNDLMRINIRLLTSAVTQSMIVFDDIATQCNEIVIDAFHSSHLSVKTYSLKHFRKLSSRIKETNVDFPKYLTILIGGIADIENRIQLWIDHGKIKGEEIAKYFRSASELLEAAISVKCVQNSGNSLLISSVFHLIGNHIKSMVAGYNEIACTAFGLLRSIFETNSSAGIDHSADICQLVHDSADRMEYFTQSIGLLMFAKPTESALIWKFIDKQCEDLLKKENSIQVLEQNLKYLSAIFQCIRDIENISKISEQKEKCRTLNFREDNLALEMHKVANEDSKFKGTNYFFSDFEAKVRKVLSLFKHIVTDKNISIDQEILFMISKLSMFILSVSDAREMDEYLQLQIMLFALCPLIQFSELLHDHFRQAFDSSSSKVKNAFFSHGNQSNAANDSLEILKNIDAKYLASNNREMLMDFLMQIVLSLNDPQYRVVLLQIATNSVIQDAFNLENFKKLLRSSVSNIQTQLAFTTHLQRFLCLTLGNCTVIKILKNNRIYYEIVCKDCDKVDQNDENFYEKSIEKHNGLCVRLTRIPIEWDEELCLKIFKLFLSEDATIRNNITKHIPSLLTHLDEFCFRKQYVELWLTPVIHNQLSNQISSSKQISFIQRALKVNIIVHSGENALICPTFIIFRILHTFPRSSEKKYYNNA